MAEKKSGKSDFPEKRPVLIPSDSSSTEISTAASSELQPLGRVSSSVLPPSSLSSYSVPVRLDVLYFLLNSAARGAQNALPSLPAYGGQGSFSTCPCSATQHVVSCCSCSHHYMCGNVPNCANVPQPIQGTHHLGAPQGGCGNQGSLNTAVPENQNSGYRWGSTVHQSNGKGWIGSGQPHSASVWRNNQSVVPQKEDQRREGAGGSNRGSWQGKWSNNGRSWGDRRQGSTEPYSRRSGSKNWGREGSPFASNSGSSRRNQEWSHRKMPWDVPGAKQRSEDVGMGWQKNQGKLESTTSLSKAVDAGPAKPSLIQAGGEDWDMDYESREASSTAQASVSHSADQKKQGSTPRTNEKWENEYVPSYNPPELKLKTPLSEPPSKNPESSATKKESSGCHEDQSKNGGFVSYLKCLSSDQPGKSSSEGSTDLAIDTDIDSSKPSEEEQSPKNIADKELKASK